MYRGFSRGLRAGEPGLAGAGAFAAAGGLEQTVKGLLWLRRSGLWRGEVVIEDCGLDEDGAALARALAEENGVLFTGDVPDRI